MAQKIECDRCDAQTTPDQIKSWGAITITSNAPMASNVARDLCPHCLRAAREFCEPLPRAVEG